MGAKPNQINSALSRLAENLKSAVHRMA